MAKKLTNMPTNLSEYPNSFKRQDAFPLDAYELFYSESDAQAYAKNNPLAYVGQTIKVVTNDNVKTYTIKDTEGTLHNETTEEKSNREEYDRRITGLSKEYYEAYRIPKEYQNSNEKLNERISAIENSINIVGGGVPTENPESWTGEY